jgi:hypothetical protein
MSVTWVVSSVASNALNMEFKSQHENDKMYHNNTKWCNKKVYIIFVLFMQFYVDTLIF